MDSIQNSIQKAEQTLKELKAQKPRTKQQKSLCDQAKSALNKIYNENKRAITEFEKTNSKFIVVMHSTNGFYKIFGHSALFYTYFVAPKLNLEVNLRADGDFTDKSPTGFVSLRNPEIFTENFRKFGLKQQPTKDKTGNFLLFKFPKAFTEEQLAEMLEKYHAETQNFNHIVMVENISPTLFLQIENLSKALFENVRSMNSQFEREILGADLIKAAAEMNHLYLKLTNGLIDKQTCLKSLREQLNFIKFQTKFIADLKIWTPRVITRIGDHIIKVQDILIRELKRS